MSNRVTTPYEIAVVNNSRLKDIEVARGVGAVYRQVVEHVSPVWGRQIPVEYDPKPEGRDFIIEIVDETTEAGAAGFHTISEDPDEFGRVIGQVSLDNDFPWTAVLSHEVLEMLVNPSVADMTTNWPEGLIYAREICDPVQSTIYKICLLYTSDAADE